MCCKDENNNRASRRLLNIQDTFGNEDAESIDYFKKRLNTNSSQYGLPAEIDLSHFIQDDEEQLATGQIETPKIDDYFKDKSKLKIKIKPAQEIASIEYLKLKEMDIPLEKEKLKQRRKERKKRQMQGGDFTDRSTKSTINQSKIVKVYSDTVNSKINRKQIQPKNNIFYNCSNN